MFKQKKFEFDAKEAHKLTEKTKIDRCKKYIEPFILELIFGKIKEATEKGLYGAQIELVKFPEGIPEHHLSIEDYFKKLGYSAEFENTHCFSNPIISIRW
jgi:hypothetical protein